MMIFNLQKVRVFFTIAISAIVIANWSDANADWRKDIGTFRIGMVGNGDVAETIAGVEPFRLALAESLGLNVEIFVAKNFQTLINAHAASRIEYAIYSATAYATAWKLCQCIEPLVVPRSSDGSQSYKSVVIASQSGPNQVTELATSKLSGLTRDSFAGHKFAVFELLKAGIKLPENMNFSASGEDAIGEFVDGKQNALIGWSSLSGDPARGYSRGTMHLVAMANGGKIAPFRMIWSSSAIPHRPHVIRKSVNVEAKKILRNVLSTMFERDPVAYDSIEPAFGGGFVVARHGQFLPIIQYVENLVPDEVKSAEPPEDQDSTKP